MNQQQQHPSSRAGTVDSIVMEVANNKAARARGSLVIKLRASGKNQHPSKSLGRTVTVVVDRSYRDHATSDFLPLDASNGNNIRNDDDEQHVVVETTHRCRGRGGIAVTFPEKLFDMLTAATTESFDHIISWQPHGRSFLIHNKNVFVQTVLPRFFDQTKIASFQRQLNIYNFVRLSKGCDRGGYYHELFLRGRPNLCRRIVRTTIKGRSQKDSGSSSITNAAVTSTMSEPNFYSMVHCYDTHSNDINMEPQHATVSSNLHNIEKAKMRPSASCEASSNSIEDAFNAESIKRQLHDKECHPAYLFPPVNAIFSTEPLPYHSCHGVVSSETIGVRQEQLKWSSSDPAYTMFSSDNFTSECPPYIAEQLLQGAASILLQIEAPDLRACYSQGSHFGNKTNVHQPRVGQNSDPSCSLFPTNIVVTPTPSPQHRRSVITTVGGTRPQLKHPNGVAVATGNESLLEDSAFPSPCCDKQMRCSEKLSLVSLLTPFAMAAFQNHSKGEVDDDQDWTRQVASDECFVFDDEDEMSTFGSLSVSSGF